MISPTLLLRIRPLVAGLVVLAAACSSGARKAETGAAPVSRGAPLRGSANLIVFDEIANSGASDALQAVTLLRPSMLRGRNGNVKGSSGGAEIVVYIDGMKSGGPGALNNVTAMSIAEIRYISAADATTRFGTGHPLGAILVATRR